MTQTKSQDERKSSTLFRSRKRDYLIYEAVQIPLLISIGATSFREGDMCIASQIMASMAKNQHIEWQSREPPDKSSALEDKKGHSSEVERTLRREPTRSTSAEVIAVSNATMSTSNAMDSKRAFDARHHVSRDINVSPEFWISYNDEYSSPSGCTPSEGAKMAMHRVDYCFFNLSSTSKRIVMYGDCRVENVDSKLPCFSQGETSSVREGDEENNQSAQSEPFANEGGQCASSPNANEKNIVASIACPDPQLIVEFAVKAIRMKPHRKPPDKFKCNSLTHVSEGDDERNQSTLQNLGDQCSQIIVAFHSASELIVEYFPGMSRARSRIANHLTSSFVRGTAIEAEAAAALAAASAATRESKIPSTIANPSSSIPAQPVAAPTTTTSAVAIAPGKSKHDVAILFGRWRARTHSKEIETPSALEAARNRLSSSLVRGTAIKLAKTAFQAWLVIAVAPIPVSMIASTAIIQAPAGDQAQLEEPLIAADSAIFVAMATVESVSMAASVGVAVGPALAPTISYAATMMRMAISMMGAIAITMVMVAIAMAMAMIIASKLKQWSSVVGGLHLQQRTNIFRFRRSIFGVRVRQRRSFWAQSLSRSCVQKFIQKFVPQYPFRGSVRRDQALISLIFLFLNRNSTV
jgi:hypothetical protein